MNTNLLNIFFSFFHASEHIHLITAGVRRDYVFLSADAGCHILRVTIKIFCLRSDLCVRRGSTQHPSLFTFDLQIKCKAREKFSHGIAAASVDTFGSIQLTVIQMEFKYDEGSAERISFSAMTKVHS